MIRETNEISCSFHPAVVLSTLLAILHPATDGMRPQPAHRPGGGGGLRLLVLPLTHGSLGRGRGAAQELRGAAPRGGHLLLRPHAQRLQEVSRLSDQVALVVCRGTDMS